jgi:hypothetical protein
VAAKHRGAYSSSAWITRIRTGGQAQTQPDSLDGAFEADEAAAQARGRSLDFDPVLARAGFNAAKSGVVEGTR